MTPEMVTSEQTVSRLVTPKQVIYELSKSWAEESRQEWVVEIR